MKLIEQENGQALVLLRKINRMKTRKNALEIELMRSPINKKINKTQKLIESGEAELKKICTHSKKSKKHEYIGGSYYDREKFINITICDICGEELDKETISGGYG